MTIFTGTIFYDGYSLLIIEIFIYIYIYISIYTYIIYYYYFTLLYFNPVTRKS